LFSIQLTVTGYSCVYVTGAAFRLRDVSLEQRPFHAKTFLLDIGAARFI
jgi:hypothetical protein